MFPISQKSLLSRSIRTFDQASKEVALFPLFESNSWVSGVLLVLRETGELSAVRWKPGLIRTPVFGSVSIRAEETLTPLHQPDLDWIEPLWHFDPWWLLDDRQFENHWARSVLKTTNAVGSTTESVDMVYFRRDLSRVQFVKEGDSVKKWRPDLLPSKPRVPRASRVPHHWSLRPFWETSEGTIWRTKSR